MACVKISQIDYFYSIELGINRFFELKISRTIYRFGLDELNQNNFIKKTVIQNLSSWMINSCLYLIENIKRRRYDNTEEKKKNDVQYRTMSKCPPRKKNKTLMKIQSWWILQSKREKRKNVIVIHNTYHNSSSLFVFCHQKKLTHSN